MKRLAAVFSVVVALGGSSVALAQDSLVGTYTGNYTPAGTVRSPLPIGVELKITKEENGVVEGTVRISSRGTCRGDYPMTGKYEGGKLVMRSSEKSGSAGDCFFSINTMKEGNKLVGTTGSGRPVELSK